MGESKKKTELIVIAGSNGSGKTTVTQEFLHHEWSDGVEKIIARYYKSIVNCETIANKVDRLYLYDNSIDGEMARPLFRLTDGVLEKMYVDEVPEWALHILPNTDED